MSDGNGKTQERRTLVEEETQFKGTMSSRCPVVVMGRLEGEVDAPSLHVTASGAVAGTVVVQELSSEGELAGEVDADSVQLSGTVKDNTVIRAKAIEVRLARTNGKMEVVFGECELAIGDEPDKAAAIEAAKNPVKEAAPATESVAAEEQPAADGAAAEDQVSADAAPAEGDSGARAATEREGDTPAAEDAPAEDAAASEASPPTPADGGWDLADGGEDGGESKRAKTNSDSKKRSSRRQRRNSQSPPPA